MSVNRNRAGGRHLSGGVRRPLPVSIKPAFRDNVLRRSAKQQKVPQGRALKHADIPLCRFPARVGTTPVPRGLEDRQLFRSNKTYHPANTMTPAHQTMYSVALFLALSFLLAWAKRRHARARHPRQL